MGLTGWIIKKAIGPGERPPAPVVPRAEAPPHPFELMSRAESPADEMWGQKFAFPSMGMQMMHLGGTDTGWMTTQRQGHALILGPPRSHAGKTAAVMTPAIISMFGPVVSTSTKPDVVRATALARAPYGRVWAYCPDGDTTLPPGLVPLRWSPLMGAEDWGTALKTARSITRALSQRQMEGGEHWKDRAGDTLAPVFHWAALSHSTMRDARDAVSNLLTDISDPGNPGKRVKVGTWIGRELRRYGADAAAVGLLANIMSTQEREQSSIISTAVRALGVYQLPGAIASTERPNFDPAAFVAGRYGRSTVYIMSSNENQEMTAPLVVGFLSQIRQATYNASRWAEQESMSGRQAGSPTVAMMLDEIYGIAPIPDLANMLSEGGSQGVLVMAAVQDLALIKDRWREAGESFMTLFGDCLILPGIRHGETLEAVSRLAGDYDHGRPTVSWTYGARENSMTEGMTYDRRRILPPETVARGPSLGDQDVSIHLSPRGIGMLRLTPYWRSAPWPQVLTQCMELATASPVPGWRTAIEADGTDSLLTDLPCPDLMSWAMQWQGRDPWAARYLAAAQRWQRLSQPGLPLLDVAADLPHVPRNAHEGDKQETEHERPDTPVHECKQRRHAKQHRDDEVVGALLLLRREQRRRGLSGPWGRRLHRARERHHWRLAVATQLWVVHRSLLPRTCGARTVGPGIRLPIRSVGGAPREIHSLASASRDAQPIRGLSKGLRTSAAIRFTPGQNLVTDRRGAARCRGGRAVAARVREPAVGAGRPRSRAWAASAPDAWRIAPFPREPPRRRAPGPREVCPRPSPPGRARTNRWVRGMSAPWTGTRPPFRATRPVPRGVPATTVGP